MTAEQKINGVNNGWAGIRVPYEYVQKYFNARNADYTTGEYTVNDKRGGMFYIKGRQESMNDALYVFLNGWTCLKFNNIPHNMTNDEFLATAASKAYSDIDFPMIRLGEIYLIYAEACMNLGQANTALPKLKELTVKFSEMQARVEAGDKEVCGFKDFHARRLVETAGHIIITYLLARQAGEAEEYAASARVFCKLAEAKIAEAYTYVMNSTTEDVALFKAVENEV